MKKKGVLLLLFIMNIALMGLLLWEKYHIIGQISGSTVVVSEGTVEEKNGMKQEQIKKIALTFDDEVIIGLSQEIGAVAKLKIHFATAPFACTSCFMIW